MTKRIAALTIGIVVVSALAVAEGTGGFAPKVYDEGVLLPGAAGINFTGNGVVCASTGTRGASCQLNNQMLVASYGEVAFTISDGGAFAGGKTLKVDQNGFPNFGPYATQSTFRGDAGTLSLFNRQVATKPALTEWNWHELQGPPVAWQDGLSTVTIANYNATGTLGTASTLGGTMTQLASGSELSYVSDPNFGGQGIAKRQVFSTGSTAGNKVDLYGLPTVWRGNDAGLGGFFCSWDFFLSWDAGYPAQSYAFIGLSGRTGAYSLGTPQYASDSDTAYLYNNNGTWSMCGNNDAGTSTCISTCSAAYDAGAGTNSYRLLMYAPPNGTAINMQLRRIDPGGRNGDLAPCSGTISTDIPGQDAFLVPRTSAYIQGAGAPVILHLVKQYCQTPY